MAQTGKTLPTMQETWIQSLGLKDPLEREMATHSTILAWRIPWTEEPDRGLNPRGRKELDKSERLTIFFHMLNKLVTDLLTVDR